MYCKFKLLQSCKMLSSKMYGLNINVNVSCLYTYTYPSQIQDYNYFLQAVKGRQYNFPLWHTWKRQARITV